LSRSRGDGESTAGARRASSAPQPNRRRDENRSEPPPRSEPRSGSGSSESTLSPRGPREPRGDRRPQTTHPEDSPPREEGALPDGESGGERVDWRKPDRRRGGG